MAFSVIEKTTQQYTASFVDELGVGITSGTLNTLALTLYDKVTGTKINSRNQQNTLNANDVAVSSSGLLTWTMQPIDNAIITDGLSQELHLALWEWTYGAAGGSSGGTGPKAGKAQAAFSIVNLTNVL